MVACITLLVSTARSRWATETDRPDRLLWSIFMPTPVGVDRRAAGWGHSWQVTGAWLKERYWYLDLALLQVKCPFDAVIEPGESPRRSCSEITCRCQAGMGVIFMVVPVKYQVSPRIRNQDLGRIGLFRFRFGRVKRRQRGPRFSLLPANLVLFLWSFTPLQKQCRTTQWLF